MVGGHGQGGRRPKADPDSGVDDVMIRVDAERMRDGQPAWTFPASGGPLDGGSRADGASVAECTGRASAGLREAGLAVPF